MHDFPFETISNGKQIKKLIVFLHGYNSAIEDVKPYAETLSRLIKNSLIVIPVAQYECERNKEKKQWFALTDIDPERKRRQIETSTSEIIYIYNKASSRISLVAKELNKFISHIQKTYSLDDENTYLMGFSQGAMLALYTGLTRKKKLGGVFVFAGVICGKDSLEKEIKSAPDVHLFHGTDDLFVQYKTLDYTKEWLDMHDIYWEAIEYDNLTHKLTDEEMADAAKIINE